SPPEDVVTRTGGSGSPVRNAGATLQSMLTRMSEVNSLRTRLQTFMPTGQSEAMIESVKPDRMHVTSPYGEMIQIGRKLYMKTAAGWEVRSMPAGGAQSDAGFDFRTFVKQMTARSGVRITGQMLGSQMIDGVETLAYEFEVTDGSETGTMQVSIGKEDGYMRRISLSGGPVNIKIWFSNINEPLSIEPPM
ncbi:MAG: hypothetical protein WAV20_04915, partial [Blastocatellia bacterium]